MHSCDNFSYCLRNILSFIRSLLWLNTNARLNCLLVKILSLYLCLWLWSWLHLYVANPVFVFFFHLNMFFIFKKGIEVFSDLLNLQLKDRIFFSLCADQNICVDGYNGWKAWSQSGFNALSFLLELCLSLYGLSFLLWVTWCFMWEFAKRS